MKVINLHSNKPPCFLSRIVNSEYAKVWNAYEELFGNRCNRVMTMMKEAKDKPENEKIKWIREADKAFRVAANMKSQWKVSAYLDKHYDVLKVQKVEDILYDYGTFKSLKWIIK